MKRYSTFFILLALNAASFAQEYTYDSRGNLAFDGNKQIAFIHYNHLDLVDTITYTDGRRIIYTYLASGQKLNEQAVDAGGKIITNKAYMGGFLYNKDTLREIQHSDGRAVPALPANSATAWEYQYHLKDHLGDVRTTITAAPIIENNAASFETTAANGFLRYEDARRVNAVIFDHTRAGATHYSQRLNGSANEKYGLARSLSVMPGDTVKLEVFAKYVDPNVNNLTAALSTFLTQIAARTAPAGAVADGAGYATNGATLFPFAGLNNTSSSTGNGPKAFLNWVVFNRDFIFKSGGFVRMTTAAKENGSNVAHEKLSATLVIGEPGYVYVYLSNEEATPVEVYFDDLSVTQVMGPVIQQSDYDPLGLTFNDFSRENTARNDFLYNGKEMQKDFNLNWYDYGARMYDAALGRWHVNDPKAEKYSSWSPYNYVMNNPVKQIDPNGSEAELIIDYDQQAMILKANFYAFENFGTLINGLAIWNYQSGKLHVNYDGRDFAINFDLSASLLREKTSDALLAQVNNDDIGNGYETPDIGKPSLFALGIELANNSGNYIKQFYNLKDPIVVAHEVGHSLMDQRDDYVHVPHTFMSESEPLFGRPDTNITGGILYSIFRNFGMVKGVERRKNRYAEAGVMDAHGNFKVTGTYSYTSLQVYRRWSIPGNTKQSCKQCSSTPKETAGRVLDLNTAISGTYSFK